jgi:outer membrane biosynthesis protein TonB
MISAFLLSPQNKNKRKTIPYFREPVLTIIDIPNTQQSISSAPRPAVPLITTLLEPIAELEPLPDIKINETSLNNSNQTGESNSKSIGTGTDIYNASSLPFVPRQILEVIPQKINGVKGSIKVSVLVGIDGYAKQLKILYNSTESILCLAKVEEAVYKSRWQPVTIENQNVEYWIEKTYTFNN